MNPMLRHFLWLIPLLLVACSKEVEQNAVPSESPSAGEAPAVGVAGDANQANTLAELTQTVRKYAAEKQRVPKDLNEVVTAGYLPSIPAAPAGKKYAISKQLEVYLADQ
jgi:hypothetical protein